MTGWLASVTDADEARLVLAAGADIVDAKNPHAGALGALPLDTVRAIVNAVGGQAPVSATVGDFPNMEPHAVARAVDMMAATGVDFVKIGLFPAPALHDCLAALAPLCGQHRLVAVLFADRNPDIGLADRLAEYGFAGIMLDTLDKTAGGLLRHQPVARLARFVDHARQRGLISGLAGSLRVTDIPILAPLGADYLGFRGALCRNHARTQSLDTEAMLAVSDAIVNIRGMSEQTMACV
ncbi:MAG: (5-formylfuran-3-yl)methyl phosphate synthase [Thiobacillus sp.]|uniref:(5-formylfuran-3-yl)methyl phosphate synthase n=1 Tax=Thiobacillus sp. TaxID=924 RepID=UPI00168CA0F4|nr:(5-formylfuran-3-yl)methyl phosphate synthase [Thiobacillus sp.]QLQ02076.1 MAG: (5-formylfuran-3-yl)methyl phosphate synthase [Thiobacillus sp.]